MRRRGVEIDCQLVDLGQPLLHRAGTGKDGIEALDAPLPVEAQRVDVELLLVAEGGIEAGPVEAGGGSQFVDRVYGKEAYDTMRFVTTLTFKVPAGLEAPPRPSVTTPKR